MKIRKATLRDLNEISEVFRIETSKKPYVQGWNKKTSFNKINELFKKEDIYLAEIEKKIVGFIISRIKKGKDAFVDEFWVLADYQGKGIGRALLKFLEKESKRRGIKNVTLIANKKAKAVDFYKKMGYKIKHELLYFKRKLK